MGDGGPAVITTFHTTDSLGRVRTIHICDAGHWHQGRRQAVECNKWHRDERGTT